jgi:LysM repeat protein
MLQRNVKKDGEALLVTSKEAGLAVNAYFVRNTFVSDEQNLGQVHSSRIDAGSFENVIKLRPKLHALINPGQIKLRG